MSTITKISSTQEEAYSYASEERKLEMRRRMQLQARGKANLSLSSLEESAQQHAATHLKSTHYRNRNYFPNLDNYAKGENALIFQPHDLVDGRILLQLSVPPDTAEDNPDYLSLKKAENFLIDDAARQSEKIFKNQTLKSGPDRVPKTLLMGAIATDDGVGQLQGAKNITQKIGAFEVDALNAFKRKFDNILENLKKFSNDVEFQDDAKSEVLSMMSNLLERGSGLPFSNEGMTKAKGYIRFLNAYIESLPVGHPCRNELLFYLRKSFQDKENISDSQVLESLSVRTDFEEKLRIESAVGEGKMKKEPVESTRKDLDTIYLYLETITSALAAPTLPIMFERFSKVSKYQPDLAIQGLAITGAGMDTIELVASEAERRLNNISEKIEALSKNNTQSSSFKAAIAEEREKLKSALSNFEQLSSRRMDRQVLEKEQERHHGETTLPSLIAKAS